ncbi:MAG: hypothetical protein AAF950_06875 [Pseudomonadota bacterium]
MNPLNKHQAAGRSIFMSSVQGLANLLAFICTFIGAPPLYSKTIGWVQSFIVQHYGYGLADITSLVWGITCGLFIFFLSRMSISTALVMGGLAVAARMF